MKWEYRVFYIRGQEDTEEELNKASADGWRLVQMEEVSRMDMSGNKRHLEKCVIRRLRFPWSKSI